MSATSVLIAVAAVVAANALAALPPQPVAELRNVCGSESLPLPSAYYFAFIDQVAYIELYCDDPEKPLPADKIKTIQAQRAAGEIYSYPERLYFEAMRQHVRRRDSKAERRDEGPLGATIDRYEFRDSGEQSVLIAVFRSGDSRTFYGQEAAAVGAKLRASGARLAKSLVATAPQPVWTCEQPYTFGDGARPTVGSVICNFPLAKSAAVGARSLRNLTGVGTYACRRQAGQQQRTCSRENAKCTRAIGFVEECSVAHLEESRDDDDD